MNTVINPFGHIPATLCFDIGVMGELRDPQKGFISTQDVNRKYN